MSEQRRIGDQQESREGWRRKKKDLKEKGKGRKRKIYFTVMMEHIKKKAKGLEGQKFEQCRIECG